MLSEQDKLERISATVPASVIKQFKELCKKERRSMSAQITLLMEKALEEQKEEVTA
ncbi:CopG family transcriptional regulator [cyanobacterium TDX16]|nr:CopG family transcriptional regulator [cyanobacterium TDX16]